MLNTLTKNLNSYRYYCRECFSDAVVRHSVLSHNHDGVVACDCADYKWDVRIIDVVGYAAGIAWARFDYADVS